jgi:hypothetical protein
MAFDFDSDQTVVDAPNPSLTRRIAEVLDGAVPSPWIGRQMFALFRTAGLVDIRVVPDTSVLTGPGGFAMYRQLNHRTIRRGVRSGQITPAEEAAWWADLEQVARTGAFCSINLGLIVTGRRPWR